MGSFVILKLMSDPKDLFGAKDGLKAPDNSKSKRKMTAAIIEEQEKEKEKDYGIFEDDDDFEEFEIGAYGNQDDVDMGAPEVRHTWQQDWQDENDKENFQATLRQQLALTKE